MGVVVQSAPSNMFQFLLVVSLAGLSFGGTPICNTVWEEKCWDEPRQQCNTVQKPYTSTYYEDEGKTVKVPKVETVPEKKCGTIAEQKCATKYEEVCHVEHRDVCNIEYKDEQKWEESSETKTDIVTKNKCELVLEEKCYQVPKNTCDTVEKPVTKYRQEEECN